MYSIDNDSYIKGNDRMNIIIYISYAILSAFILLSYFDKNSRLNRKYDTLMEYKGNVPKEYKRIVVYSCLIGDYDIVSNFNKQIGYDYILFTDQNIVNTNWTILPIPKEVKKLDVSDVKKQRYIKIHPHKFFKNYDLSLYRCKLYNKRRFK